MPVVTLIRLKKEKTSVLLSIFVSCMITSLQYIFTRHKVYTCIAGRDNIHILEDFGYRGLGLIN